MQLVLSSASNLVLLGVRPIYPLVEVDGVLAGHDISDGRALSLAGGLLGGRHSEAVWWLVRGLRKC